MKRTRVVKERTKMGCATCRKRRVKCDETRPVCSNCKRGERQCDYSTRFDFKQTALAEFGEFENQQTQISKGYKVGLQRDVTRNVFNARLVETEDTEGSMVPGEQVFKVVSADHQLQLQADQQPQSTHAPQSPQIHIKPEPEEHAFKVPSYTDKSELRVPPAALASTAQLPRDGSAPDTLLPHMPLPEALEKAAATCVPPLTQSHLTLLHRFVAHLGHEIPMHMRLSGEPNSLMDGATPASYWTHDVPQMAFSQGYLMSAILAYSSVCQFPLSEAAKRSGMFYYQQAIEGLAQEINARPDSINVAACVSCCVLLTCYETYWGDLSNWYKHMAGLGDFAKLMGAIPGSWQQLDLQYTVIRFEFYQSMLGGVKGRLGPEYWLGIPSREGTEALTAGDDISRLLMQITGFVAKQNDLRASMGIFEDAEEVWNSLKANLEHLEAKWEHVLRPVRRSPGIFGEYIEHSSEDAMVAAIHRLLANVILIRNHPQVGTNRLFYFNLTADKTKGYVQEMLYRLPVDIKDWLFTNGDSITMDLTDITSVGSNMARLQNVTRKVNRMSSSAFERRHSTEMSPSSSGSSPSSASSPTTSSPASSTAGSAGVYKRGRRIKLLTVAVATFYAAVQIQDAHTRDMVTRWFTEVANATTCYSIIWFIQGLSEAWERTVETEYQKSLANYLQQINYDGAGNISRLDEVHAKIRLAQGVLGDMASILSEDHKKLLAERGE
ncbi:putative transcriptional regulatory protein [Yarrowia sp. B02]|nr:putative transcriptional regulatory protein [Yarrowia sp. B02]